MPKGPPFFFPWLAVCKNQHLQLHWPNVGPTLPSFTRWTSSRRREHKMLVLLIDFFKAGCKHRAKNSTGGVWQECVSSTWPWPNSKRSFPSKTNFKAETRTNNRRNRKVNRWCEFVHFTPRQKPIDSVTKSLGKHVCCFLLFFFYSFADTPLFARVHLKFASAPPRWASRLKRRAAVKKFHEFNSNPYSDLITPIHVERVEQTRWH